MTEPRPHPGFTEVDDALFAACIHCGLCLETCPTFVLTGREDESPRGRLLIARGLASGRWAAEEATLAPIDHCLGCRACETACPSGVHYGRILEHTRAVTSGRPVPRSRLERALVRHLLWRGAWLERIAAVYRALGVGWVARKLAEVPRLPAAWRDRLRLAPRLERPRRRPRPGNQNGPTAFLLRGCAARAFFPQSEAAIVCLLEATGYAVVRLDRPECCGALAAHAGEPDVARRFDRAVVELLAGRSGILVATASGCGAHLRELGTRVGSAEAEGIAARVRDWTEVVAGASTPLPWRRDSAERVVVQDPCHLRHGQGIVEPPRILLRAAGFQLVEAEEPDLCCGSAGTYNLAEPEMAAALGRRKADRLRATGARLAVTANPGCVLQLAAYLDRPGDPEVRGLATLLAERLPG